MPRASVLTSRRRGSSRRSSSSPRSFSDPTFPAAEIDRLRDERLNDLLQAQADPRRRADETFIGTIYAPTAPYHRPAAGTRETVERLDESAVRRAYERILDPARATLVVGGDLGGQDVAAVARRLLGSWTTRRRRSRAIAGRRRGGGIGTSGPRGPSPGQRPDRDPRRPSRVCPVASRTTTPSR